MEFIKKLTIDFIKDFRWIYLVFILLLSLITSISNNLRVEESRKVAWIGGQEILEVPEGY